MYSKEKLDDLFQAVISDSNDELELLQMEEENKIGYYDVEN